MNPAKGQGALLAKGEALGGLARLKERPTWGTNRDEREERKP